MAGPAAFTRSSPATEHAETHSDPWRFPEPRPRAAFPPRRSARGAPRRGSGRGLAWPGAWPGLAAGGRRGVEGHATSLSWRPARWAPPGARCGSAPPACGRARGGPRGPRVPGGAWPQPAARAPRALTATVWSCCGERAPAEGRGAAEGRGGRRADALPACGPGLCPGAPREGAWGEAAGLLHGSRNWQDAAARLLPGSRLARSLEKPPATGDRRRPRCGRRLSSSRVGAARSCRCGRPRDGSWFRGAHPTPPLFENFSFSVT